MNIKNILNASNLMICLFLLNVSNCKAQKGLFVMTMGTKSHINFFSRIVETLVENGHKMMFISPYKVAFKSGAVRSVTTEDYVEKSMGGTFGQNAAQLTQTMINYSPEACVASLTDPEVEKALQEDYDYIILSIVFSDCYLAYVHEKKIPLIYVSPNALMSPLSDKLGAPEFLSVSPVKILSYSYPLTFRERAINTVVGTIVGYIWTLGVDGRVERICRREGLWAPETPSLSYLQQNSSLAIINSVRALEIPIKSTPPSIIYAGGIHIKETKPLPKDLQDWADGSGEAGFILFSLGTLVKPSLMKKEHLQYILNVFGSLDQRIIWKWDSNDITDLPPNVKLSSWLPQQDLLAHPKIRLFITHGGLFSTQEATYFGVPVIGMPVFGDQIGNVAEIVAEQWGRQILWDELTEKKFRDIVVESLTNSSLRETVDRRSKLMKDWPTSPSQEVVYWVNYVIRHRGAKHLQSPLVHLAWYQIYNVDVWLLFISIVVLVLFVCMSLTKACIKFCVKKCFKKKTE